MIFVLAWLFAIVIAGIVVMVVMAIGLHGVRKDQRNQTDPLNKESNFWW